MRGVVFEQTLLHIKSELFRLAREHLGELVQGEEKHELQIFPRRLLIPTFIMKKTLSNGVW